MGKNFKLAGSLNNNNANPPPINIKLNKQYVEEDSSSKKASGSSQPPGRPTGETSGGAPPLKNLGLSIENSNNTIVEQQNFDNRTQTNTTHVGK